MRILSVVAIAAFVVTGAARAADDSVTALEKAPLTSQPDQQDFQVGSPAQVFGKVVSIHNCNLVGMTDPHMLVKLESAPGEIEVVDLGSTAELKSNGIEPKEGQQFWVDGRVGTINGKFLVVAERLSESKLVSISRQASLREQTTKQHTDAHADAEAKDANDGKAAKTGNSDAVAGIDAKDAKAPKTETIEPGNQVRSIEGTVVHTCRVKIEGEANVHVLAKVQTESGIVVLDLGVCSTMPDTLDLTEGKSIAASGFVGHLNGKPIILAESVGNMSNIQRTFEPATVPAGARISTANTEDSSPRK
jgi:hypothetical protein